MALINAGFKGKILADTAESVCPVPIGTPTRNKGRHGTALTWARRWQRVAPPECPSPHGDAMGHERQDLQISWHAATHSPCQRQTGGFGPERRHSRILSRREAVAGPHIGSTAPSRTGRGRSWRRRECARRKFRSLPSTPDARSAGCCAGCGGRAAMCRRPSEALETAVSGVGNPCSLKPIGNHAGGRSPSAYC